MTPKFSRVSGFNPRLVVWWLAGVKAPTSVTFPTRREATRTRQLLYSLRRAMHLEDHYAATLVDRGEIIRHALHPDHNLIDDPHILTIRPVNFHLNTVLDDAGIHPPELPETPTTKAQPTPPPLPPTTEPLDYKDLMGGLDRELDETDPK